jgi:hypothetical protein
MSPAAAVIRRAGGFRIQQHRFSPLPRSQRHEINGDLQA